jgi:hypothetical protein
MELELEQLEGNPSEHIIQTDIKEDGNIQENDDMPFLDTPVQPLAETPVSTFRPKSIILMCIFVIIYIISDLALPLYNKSLFKGFGSLNGFHFPLTCAFIQVFCVGIILLGIVLIQRGIQMVRKVESEQEWIFKNFFPKL